MERKKFSRRRQWRLGSRENRAQIGPNWGKSFKRCRRLALLLNVGLDGIGWDTYIDEIEDEPLNTFRYRYIGLPGLSAADYVEGSNILGTAFSALMKVDAERKAWLKAMALQRIGASGENEYNRFLLGEIVDTYLTLTPEQTAEFDAMVETPTFKEAKTMTTTWHKQGEAIGKARGKEIGKVEEAQLLLLKMGEKRFGKKPTKAVREKISATSDLELLETWLENVLDAATWADIFA